VVVRIDVSRRRPVLIRLAPLIDVVFILLVFFMLASSFLDWRAFEIAVPTETTAADAELEPIRVEVGADGTLAVDGEAVTRDELAAAVRARLGEASDLRPVVLTADGEAPVAATVGAFDELQAAGVSGVTLSGMSRSGAAP
jgi:biopolymer transport protein ExbD